VPVDAAFFEPGGFHQIRQGRAIIAAPIKDGGGLANDFLSRVFAFAHRAP
jgi:hypothetical protein